ncbi:MAG TPA: hypothetical protein EYG30_07330 [Planctomycetes bacterium]|nr:hypothetical protein [Planctomycetota bacterium]HIL52051.1 hypothetical protein [Planctomycetota bacterium]
MRVAFAGGGTGGHIVPGLHLVARSLAGGDAPRLDDLLWFTSGRAVEQRVLAEVPRELPWEQVKLSLEPPGGGAPSRLRLIAQTPRAFWSARCALRRHQSQVLLGLGGFTTLPAALAARSLGIPVVLLEINAAPGQATRVLGPLASRVLHAWRGSLPDGVESRRHRLAGAPVAPEVAAARIPESQEAEALTALGFDPERPLILVLGGSQGASSLNRFVEEYAHLWISAGSQVLHQCGPKKRAELGPQRPGLRVREYIAPMAPALAAARVVLCRGGASTLAEIAVAQVPAWVVPYPYHADRHQERNARELGEGVRIVSEASLDRQHATLLAEFAGAGGARAREVMRQALARASAEDSALQILLELESLAR